MRFFSVNESGRIPHAPPVVAAPIVHRLVRERCAPWLGGWPLPTAGGRQRAPRIFARSLPDHACPLQSLQKT
jgi:hypothetical protein